MKLQNHEEADDCGENCPFGCKFFWNVFCQNLLGITPSGNTEKVVVSKGHIESNIFGFYHQTSQLQVCFANFFK